MATPAQLIYYLLIAFIRTVKWIELQFLKLFSPLIIRKSVKICQELGIILHFNDESYKNWGTAEEEAALAKSKKYDKLVHLRIHDKGIFPEVANSCSYAIGEGYVSKKWDFCKDESDITELSHRVLEQNVIDLYYNWWNRMWSYLEFDLFNLQTRSRSVEVIKKHYDLGNDMYESFLDPYMQYTCGYWKDADNLDDAQLDKLELIAQKLKLKPGMRVLDIGCGWGMLCKYLAERHGVHCVGVTISEEQAQYARKKCEGLPVEIRIQDYRDVREEFDRIVVVGMIEHVGFKNYPEFFKIAHRNLKEDGIFLLHTIGVNHNNIPRSERWLCTRIFPNGCIPRPEDIIQQAKRRFVMEDWHNFGYDYHKTLHAWRLNFLRNWPTVKHNYSEEFYRVWVYYLGMSEGMWTSRKCQLWQVVFSKDGLKDYRAAR